ncbi:hypothetical protein N8482_02515 [Chitinophagales bacterium]|nr:hypothetical protein [Chitinophagales bacterium]
MTTIIKKVLYTGVGLAATTAEKVQQRVNNLVDGDDAYAKEGRKLVDVFLQEAAERKVQVSDRVKTTVEKVTEKLDLASRAEYDGLKKKIAKLERELKEKGTSKKTTVKKSK